MHWYCDIRVCLVILCLNTCFISFLLILNEFVFVMCIPTLQVSQLCMWFMAYAYQKLISWFCVICPYHSSWASFHRCASVIYQSYANRCILTEIVSCYYLIFVFNDFSLQYKSWNKKNLCCFQVSCIDIVIFVFVSWFYAWIHVSYLFCSFWMNLCLLCAYQHCRCPSFVCGSWHMHTKSWFHDFV